MSGLFFLPILEVTFPCLLGILLLLRYINKWLDFKERQRIIEEINQTNAKGLIVNGRVVYLNPNYKEPVK